MRTSTASFLAAPFRVGPKRLARRVWPSVVEDEVLERSAQLAFYVLFALIPLLVLITSLVGLFAREGIALRDDLFGYLGAVLPGSAREIVMTTVDERIVASSGGKVSFGLLAQLRPDAPAQVAPRQPAEIPHRGHIRASPAERRSTSPRGARARLQATSARRYVPHSFATCDPA